MLFFTGVKRNLLTHTKKEKKKCPVIGPKSFRKGSSPGLAILTVNKSLISRVSPQFLGPGTRQNNNSNNNDGNNSNNDGTINKIN